MCAQLAARSRGRVPHHPRAPPRVRATTGGPAPALLLLHGLGADHTTWDPVIDQLARRYTVDRARPARSRPVGQAAGRLHARRLRQRHARPADRAGHRQGDPGRALLRRRGGDAVRLPVPRAHRAAGPGRLGRPRSRGQPGDPGADHPGVRVPDGAADAARRTSRRRGRDARPVADRRQGVPRLRRGRRDLRDVQGPRRALGHLPRDPGRRRLARPGRDDGRPRLPHRGDAAVRDLGRGRPRHPRRPTPPSPPSWRRAPASR